MAFNGTPSLTPVAWAVPPSPARDICFVFCAHPDPEPDRAATGRKGHKQHQKNCANLCTIVQTKSALGRFDILGVASGCGLLAQRFFRFREGLGELIKITVCVLIEKGYGFDLIDRYHMPEML